jgi:hypothetical protein
MQSKSKTILSYTFLNFWISASITFLAWLGTSFGLGIIGIPLLFPGFIIGFLVLGGGSSAYVTLRDHLFIISSINFLFYALIIGLIQRRIYKKRARES